MRPAQFVPLVLALIANVAAGHSHSASSTHRRFHALERRAVANQEATAAIFKREDFTCGPGRPCGNRACCGKDGWCGYGPTYCGDGCTSNCDAHAECGQYAVPKDKNCPLNVCCSVHGFCGTTKNFCTGKCQSNCVEHPKPPGGGKGNTLAKVIGYYEAWNDRSKCHQTKASDLPVDGLTHVNYAFAYIDPKSFEITTMDAATPAKTFEDMASLKLSNPKLQLFVSLGGWTFSDNDTATQPVFGNIARSSSNRDKFASNLLKFLDTYGYDGVDLDWEYPGAPDRGGKEDDTKNYVLLVETLRKAFDNSGRKLGITFTAPSSFWYLRWFDLPGMIKHVDWINIMSYDLHGVWDSSNPIGAIVQGHTNLTEIKMAVELFWRVNIPPSKLSLGFGFYGRAFTLADPSCTSPGCAFSSGAKPGVCTGTSGYLAHYEIQDIISKNKKRGMTPVHDKEAAVKYMTWDNDQWISYDDADTFGQKVKWADSVGFAGSLIWASDLDDYEFSAHKAFTGKKELKSSAKALLTQLPVTLADVDVSLGQKCYKTDKRGDQCKIGFGKIGSDWDGEKCSEKDETRCGKAICCPQGHTMTECTWRGSGKDCNGRCHDGEVKVTGSSWGGGPKSESSGKSRCNRGGKAFCCKSTQFESLTEHCSWTKKCGSDCKSDEAEVAYAYDRWGYASIFCHGYKYCCKKKYPIPLRKCRWVGKGDCAENSCEPSEVTLWTNVRGDTGDDGSCNWHRNKSLCCTPSADALKEGFCDTDICADDESLCDDSAGDAISSVTRRALSVGDSGDDDTDDNESEYLSELDKRAGKTRPGEPREFTIKMTAAVGALVYSSRPYPPGNRRDYLFRARTGLANMLVKGGYDTVSAICTSPALTFLKKANLPKTKFQTEHFFELQLPKIFLKTCVTGLLPSITGQLKLQTPILNEALLLAGWNKQYATGIALNTFYDAVSGLKGVPYKYLPPSNTPSDRLMTVLGDWGNMENLLLVRSDVNGVKGQLFSLNNPMAENKLKINIAAALKGDQASAVRIETVLKSVFSVFDYINDATAEIVERKALHAITQEITNMENHMPELKGIKAIFDEFMPAYKKAVSSKAHIFVVTVNNHVKFNLATAGLGTSMPAHLSQLRYTCEYYANRVSNLKWQDPSGS